MLLTLITFIPASLPPVIRISFDSIAMGFVLPSPPDFIAILVIPPRSLRSTTVILSIAPLIARAVTALVPSTLVAFISIIKIPIKTPTPASAPLSRSLSSTWRRCRR
ncbi:hypothetical protein BM221_010847 [Beauveria bassiana]|uniref:Uncharacterized protein n=1 Tax=Beauveria bassiana TaxID=176275 RepID=A0A2N6N7U6_BEABA|nr:hypothetical protein BM221_010847 [Beauveria bassiana]